MRKTEEDMAQDLLLGLPSHKICYTCKREKTIANFYKNKNKLSSSCKECIKERAKERYSSDPEKYKKLQYARNLRDKDSLKQELYDAYGHKCTCCGEEEKAFLTIEHLQGVPNSHRLPCGRRKVGHDLIRQLRKEGWPDTCTILCWNCNMTKNRIGYCPHERKRRDN
jgi:hypothetical protein